MITIFKKELKVYFTSILGYIVMFGYLFVGGLFFWSTYVISPTTSDFSRYYEYGLSFHHPDSHYQDTGGG